MFAGLVLTSLSTIVLRAALFQRKSRSGWLEELDDIRGEALEEPNGAVSEVVDGEGIWTDLRDGGEYADPHEISSLYATDATPDSPTPKPAAKASKPRSKAPRREAEAVPSAEATPAPIAPDAAAAMGSPSPSLHDEIWTTTHEIVSPTAGAATGETADFDSDQIWVQPAPHPIRPSEMWHPAELGPAPLGQESNDRTPEDRLTQADFVGAPSEHPYPGAARVVPASKPAVEVPAAEMPAAEVPVSERPVAEPAPTYAEPVPEPSVHHDPAIEPAVATYLESELVAAADVAVVGDASVATPLQGQTVGGLVAGPVGRRVRRDRAPERQRNSLPGVELDRGDQSPLPVQPLPPAAMPTRSNRLPSLDSLPQTPSSVVAPRSINPFGQLPTSPALDLSPGVAQTSVPAQDLGSAAPVDEVHEVDEQSVTFDPAELIIDEPPLVPASAGPAPVADIEVEPAAEVTVAVADEPVEVPAAASVALPVGADGMVAVPGLIVRLGGGRDARPMASDAGATIELLAGWCWVSPGESQDETLGINLPSGQLTVTPGSTALAVVEPDGSSFVIVADGTAELHRGGDGATLQRGAIVMIDPNGAAQVDQASDDEIEGDPIVAENLSLDAEL